MKKMISILLVLVMALGLAACAGSTTTTPPSPSEDAQAPASETPSAEPASADDDWAYIKAKGEIIIGITEYAPMNYYENGTLVGFDTEYAEAVCAKLGVTPKFIVINWDTKEVELKAKTIDCIWNGLTVTEERKANMAFTDSYIINEQVLVVPAANADKYTDKASLKGVSIVAESGSAGESAIQSDLPDAAYTAVDSQAKALLEVKAGTAAAAVIDATMAEAMIGEGTDYADLTVVKAIDLTDEEYAIGFRVGSSAVAEFNKVTDELIADGTLPAIAEKYKLADRLITK